MNLFYFLLSVFCAFIGGELVSKLNIPAARVVGGIIGVIILNLTYGHSYFYEEIRIWMQIFSGAMIGSRIGKKEILQLKVIILPTAMLLVCMILMNVTLGGIIYKFSALDITTALFAVTPGGLSDMALLSSDLGANSSYVGILQVFRLLIIFLIFPPIFKQLIKRDQLKKDVTQVQTPVTKGSTVAPFTLTKFLKLILCSATGGLLFNYLGMVGGGLTGAMIGSAIYCICTSPVRYPELPKNGIQILSGVFIGTDITWELIKNMNELLLPMAVMLVGYTVYILGLALLMHKVCKMDLTVCLLASTPGGIQEMALFSEDLKADTPKIAIMQTARLLLIITFFPTMITFIVNIFG